MRRVIWTVYRVMPEQGRRRLLDTPDEDLAVAELRRQVGLAAAMDYGVVELRRDGELVERWAARQVSRAGIGRTVGDG